MGWLEFQAWLEIRAKQLAPPEPDPFSWDGAGSEGYWQEAARLRDERLGA